MGRHYASNPRALDRITCPLLRARRRREVAMYRAAQRRGHAD
jgi:hypothetical protein